MNQNRAPQLWAQLTAAERAHYPGQLLELSGEVGPACHHLCSFCFNGVGRQVAATGMMNPAHYERMLREFAALGGQTVGWPGCGEPLHRRNWPQMFYLLELAHELGLRSLVYTAGDLVDDQKIEAFRRFDVSIAIKVSSFVAEVQDRLVGTDGYAKRRDQALADLMIASLNSHERTRLAIVSSLLPENVVADGSGRREIHKIYRFCLRNNIMPDIDTLLSFGRGQAHGSPSTKVIRQVFRELQQIARDEFGIEWEISPAYVGSHCARYDHHLYVDYLGHVSPCLGANKRGVVLGDARKKDSLRRAWESQLMARVRARDYSGQCTSCRLFQSGGCNSCLGRYIDRLDEDEVHTIGCWNYQPAE